MYQRGPRWRASSSSSTGSAQAVREELASGLLLVGANLGALLNRRSSSDAVKLLFGTVFACVALKFVLSFSGGQA